MGQEWQRLEEVDFLLGLPMFYTLQHPQVIWFLEGREVAFTQTEDVCGPSFIVKQGQLAKGLPLLKLMNFNKPLILFVLCYRLQVRFFLRGQIHMLLDISSDCRILGLRMLPTNLVRYSFFGYTFGDIRSSKHRPYDTRQNSILSTFRLLNGCLVL